MAFEVPITTYLEMTQGLRGVSRFQLQNQTLKGGKIIFNGAGGRKRLEAIVNFYNKGTVPEGVLLDPYVMAVGDFTVEDLERNVDALRGPDDEGYYHGRCPSCKALRNGDTGKDHFYANPSTGQMGCFAGCKKKDVKKYIAEKLQPLTVGVKDAEVVNTERSDATNDKLQTKARIVEQNLDFLIVEKSKKNGEPGTSHQLDIAELKTFAQSLASFKKGQHITIQEHYDALGWDLVEDQGTRKITRKYHPYIAALYALGEIDVYKDGSIRRN